MVATRAHVMSSQKCPLAPALEGGALGKETVQLSTVDAHDFVA